MTRQERTFGLARQADTQRLMNTTKSRDESASKEAEPSATA